MNFSRVSYQVGTPLNNKSVISFPMSRIVPEIIPVSDIKKIVKKEIPPFIKTTKNPEKKFERIA